MRNRRLVALILGIGVAAIAALALSGPSRPTGSAYATSVLLTSVPDPWTGPENRRFEGMSRFNARELTDIMWGARFGTKTFVPATVASLDPEVISVNPIDDFTWGAAAYSTRQQRCYLIVSVHDRDRPEYRVTLHGRLAPGQRCVGTAAIPANATSTESLPE